MGGGVICAGHENVGEGVYGAEELGGELRDLITAECKHHTVGGDRQPRLALHRTALVSA